jgi:hypothetical protein
MLGSLGALLAIPFVGKLKAEEWPHVDVVHTPNGYCRVTGSEESIERFHDAWQTHLWPDWKTSGCDGARKEWRIVKKYCSGNRFDPSTGKLTVHFDATQAINRKAIRAACTSGMSVVESCEAGANFCFA